MRILWLNHRAFDDPRAGGAERTIFEVSRRLVKWGHSVSLLSAGHREGHTGKLVDGVVVRCVGGPLALHAASALYANEHYDLVVEDLAHVVPWFTPWLSDSRGTAFFRHLHARTLGGQVPPLAAALLTRLERNYPKVYRDWPIVTESRQGIRDLIELGFPPSQCHRIPPGVDTSRFKPGARTSVPLLVYFGGLRNYKRPGHALLVARELQSRSIPFHLAILGRGPLLPELKALAGDLGIETAVSFPGRLTTDELSSLLGTAWINLHFSVAEGWCLSVMEAAAAGVPTVAYEVPGISESVVPGTSGLLAKDGDIGDLTNRVTEILHSPQHWWASSRRVVESRGWDRVAEDWERYLTVVFSSA